MKNKTLVFTGVAFLLLTTTVARTEAATLTVTVDGDGVYAQSIPSTQDSDGSTRYTGAVDDSAGAWDFDWNIDTQPDPTSSAAINGLFTYTNTSAATQTVTMEFAMPICPAILNTSTYYSSMNVSMTANADGGALTVTEGAMFTAMADDSDLGTMFAAPFSMSTSGAGNTGTNQSLGSGGAPLAGPAVNSSMGMRLHFSITAGEIVHITPNYYLNGQTSGADCSAVVIVNPVTGSTSPTGSGLTAQGGDSSADTAAAGGCQHSHAQSPLAMVTVLIPFAMIFALKRLARA